MIGHDETGHHLALDDVSLHDFRHVGFGFDLIPHTFRIDDDARSLGTMIETPGLIGSDIILQVQPLRLLFKACVERLRAKLGTAPTGIVGTSLIGTDKYVPGECRHGSSLLGLHRSGLHPTNQLSDVGLGQK